MVPIRPTYEVQIISIVYGATSGLFSVGGATAPSCETACHSAPTNRNESLRDRKQYLVSGPLGFLGPRRERNYFYSVRFLSVLT